MARSPTLESLKLILKLLGQAELKGLESVLPPALASFSCFPLLILGTPLILSLDGHSFPVSLTSALTSLSNVWTGLDLIEPTGHSSLPVQTGHVSVHGHRPSGALPHPGPFQP